MITTAAADAITGLFAGPATASDGAAMTGSAFGQMLSAPAPSTPSGLSAPIMSSMPAAMSPFGGMMGMASLPIGTLVSTGSMPALPAAASPAIMATFGMTPEPPAVSVAFVPKMANMPAPAPVADLPDMLAAPPVLTALPPGKPALETSATVAPSLENAAQAPSGSAKLPVVADAPILETGDNPASASGMATGIVAVPVQPAPLPAEVEAPVAPATDTLPAAIVGDSDENASTKTATPIVTPSKIAAGDPVKAPAISPADTTIISGPLSPPAVEETSSDAPPLKETSAKPTDPATSRPSKKANPQQPAAAVEQPVFQPMQIAVAAPLEVAPRTVTAEPESPTSDETADAAEQEPVAPAATMQAGQMMPVVTAMPVPEGTPSNDEPSFTGGNSPAPIASPGVAVPMVKQDAAAIGKDASADKPVSMASDAPAAYQHGRAEVTAASGDEARPAAAAAQPAGSFASMIAQADRAAPAAAPAPAAPAQAPAEARVTAEPGRMGQEMGVAIARHAATGGGEALTVRLDPAEFGRIDVTLSFDDSGTLRALVAADSPAALELLRRDSADLGRALTDAGVRSDAQSFRFDTRQGSADGQGGQRSQQQPSANGRAMAADVATDIPEPEYRPLRTSGRVDLMA